MLAENPIVRTVARNIRAARKARGLTQEKLASRLGTVKGTVYQWESCKREISAESLLRISEALECPWSWFYREDVAPEVRAIQLPVTGQNGSYQISPVQEFASAISAQSAELFPSELQTQVNMAIRTLGAAFQHMTKPVANGAQQMMASEEAEISKIKSQNGGSSGGRCLRFLNEAITTPLSRLFIEQAEGRIVRARERKPA